MYIRVRDENGNEFDVPEGSRLIVKGLVELVAGVEPCSLRRPPTHAGASATEPARPVRKPRSGRKPKAGRQPAAAPAPEAPAQPEQSESDPAPDNNEKESE